MIESIKRILKKISNLFKSSNDTQKASSLTSDYLEKEIEKQVEKEIVRQASKKKYASMEEVFKDVLGEQSIKKCKRKPRTKEQKERDAKMNKAVCEYLQRLESVHKATRGSKLHFD